MRYFERKKILSNETPTKSSFEPSGRSFKTSNNNISGFGMVKNPGSETSSAASRVYDNSVDSSSLSDNLFFNEPPKGMSQSNGKLNSINPPGMKMPFAQNMPLPPPVSQRICNY